MILWLGPGLGTRAPLELWWGAGAEGTASGVHKALWVGRCMCLPAAWSLRGQESMSSVGEVALSCSTGEGDPEVLAGPPWGHMGKEWGDPR